MSNLAIVTCHFNPCGYRAPVENWWRWFESLPPDVPVTSVELSFDGVFKTDSSIKLHGTVEKNCMWQKEALLNIAIKSLPPEIDRVAWIDADIIYPDHSWVEQANRLLDKHSMVQLFNRVQFLARNGTAARSNPGAIYQSSRPVAVRKGKVAVRSQGVGERGRLKTEKAVGKRRTKRRRVSCSPGGAWAAHRDVVDVGLYDRCIVGAGDTILLHASRGRFDNGDGRRYAPQHRRDWLRWAPGWWMNVRSRIGHLDVPVKHLWHGDSKHRQYGTRPSILVTHRYDPCKHVQYNADGVLEWTDAAPESFRLQLRRYFMNRREDA